MSENICRHCQRQIPKVAFHWANILAQQEGFCSWNCLRLELGPEEVRRLLQEHARQSGRRM